MPPAGGRSTAALGMLALSMLLMIFAAICCLYGPLGAALGGLVLLLGLRLAWEAGAVAAGE